MLSINTNLSSIITQNSMKQSTNKLNDAIERMTTGYKINHAKDNAANYSISTNMTTKIGAYDVAADNVAMGMDMLTTATESLGQIENKLTRLRALATQAQNGTYGGQSKEAINAEANAITDEIERLYNTSSYNGVDLMRGRVLTQETSKFMLEIERRDISKMATMEGVDENVALTEGTYSISSAEELAKLSRMAGTGKIGANCEFVLGDNIDLSIYSNWTPIANFEAKFDGNGYEIRNMKINATKVYSGLFSVLCENAEVKNLGVVDAKITTNYDKAGLIAGITSGGNTSVNITNCYTSGEIESTMNSIGGILGSTGNCLKKSFISYCYSDAELKTTSSQGYAGGIIGGNAAADISNCCFFGKITAKNRVGGIIGENGGGLNTNSLSNCYSSATLVSNGWCGGIVGVTYGININNCYSDSIVSAPNAGGILGQAYKATITITNCSVLKDSSLRGIFIANQNVGFTTSVILENCKYNSEITSATNYVGGKENLLYSNSNISTCDAQKPFEYTTNAQVYLRDKNTNLQIGINSNENSNLEIELGFKLFDTSILRDIGIKNNNDIFNKIDSYLSLVSNKQTQLGAVQNRLESAMDEIITQHDNLVSARSTLRDADMAELSSQYIQQQILQEASATLMSTANQSPSIALQLI